MGVQQALLPPDDRDGDAPARPGLAAAARRGGEPPGGLVESVRLIMVAPRAGGRLGDRAEHGRGALRPAPLGDRLGAAVGYVVGGAFGRLSASRDESTG